VGYYGYGVCHETSYQSTVFVEADQVSILSEASSADHELVLSDKTMGIVANSAGS
jgi:hypothetical protein